MNFDRNNRALSAGDKVCWFVQAISAQGFGEITKLVGYEVKLKWSTGEEPTCLWDPMRLVKITESDFVSFLETADLTSSALGRDFCAMFNLLDPILRHEDCPGKARKRIVEHYAENLA